MVGGPSLRFFQGRALGVLHAARINPPLGQGDLHFVSLSCYHRFPFLKPPQARNPFVEILGQVRDRPEFLLLAYVVMPDHVHLLTSEPKKGTPFTVVQV
jgi:putative transposase